MPCPMSQSETRRLSSTTTLVPMLFTSTSNLAQHPSRMDDKDSSGDSQRHLVPLDSHSSIRRTTSLPTPPLVHLPEKDARYWHDIPQPSAVEEGLTQPSDKIKEGRVWPPWKRVDGLSGWGRESVSTVNLVPALVVQAFSTGVLDATTYADFHTFASNQTGNTILLTVAAFGTGRELLLLTGLSLSAFLLGALIFGHLGHIMGVRRRYWILTTTLYQILALTLAAILVSPCGPSIFHIHGQHEWLVLVLFANMSGAQVAMARQSGSQELPTAPMTSSFVDLMADKYLFKSFTHHKAGPRNRRLAYILAMITGGFLGAVVHRYSSSWAVVVVTIALKVVVAGLLCVARADHE